MKFLLSRSIVITILILAILFSLGLNVMAAEDNPNSVIDLLKRSGGAARYEVDKISGGDINTATIVGQIIQIFLSLLGAIFIGLMIYGGYEWMMARGNTEQVEKAREIIKNAIIGLVIVIASYAISYFVLYYFTQGYFQEGTTGF